MLKAERELRREIDRIGLSLIEKNRTGGDRYAYTVQAPNGNQTKIIVSAGSADPRGVKNNHAIMRRFYNANRGSIGAAVLKAAQSAQEAIAAAPAPQPPAPAPAPATEPAAPAPAPAPAPTPESQPQKETIVTATTTNKRTTPTQRMDGQKQYKLSKFIESLDWEKMRPRTYTELVPLAIKANIGFEPTVSNVRYVVQDVLGLSLFDVPKKLSSPETTAVLASYIAKLCDVAGVEVGEDLKSLLPEQFKLEG